MIILCNGSGRVSCHKRDIERSGKTALMFNIRNFLPNDPSTATMTYSRLFPDHKRMPRSHDIAVTKSTDGLGIPVHGPAL